MLFQGLTLPNVLPTTPSAPAATSLLTISASFQPWLITSGGRGHNGDDHCERVLASSPTTCDFHRYVGVQYLELYKLWLYMHTNFSYTIFLYIDITSVIVIIKIGIPLSLNTVVAFFRRGSKAYISIEKKERAKYIFCTKKHKKNNKLKLYTTQLSQSSIKK